MQILKVTAAAIVALSLSAGVANAAVIGIFGSAASFAEAAADGLGHDASVLADMSAANLAGLDVLWVLNGSNSNQQPGLAAHAAAIEAFVNGGGKLLVHDRWAGQSEPRNPNIPGGAGITLTEDFDPDDINVPATSPYFGGPIGDATLDGGNSSKHGFATGLPVGSVILLVDDADQVVDFSYLYGSGLVYYSTSPLDFYIDGGGDNGDSFRNIYTPEVLKYVTGQGGGGGKVSEPATLALLGAGLLGLAAIRRRKSA
jgi:hypothetical protein